MSALQKEVSNIILTLPEDSLEALKPLLNNLLEKTILSINPNAKISEMTETEKLLYLKMLNNSAKD